MTKFKVSHRAISENKIAKHNHCANVNSTLPLYKNQFIYKASTPITITLISKLRPQDQTSCDITESGETCLRETLFQELGPDTRFQLKSPSYYLLSFSQGMCFVPRNLGEVLIVFLLWHLLPTLAMQACSQLLVL